MTIAKKLELWKNLDIRKNAMDTLMEDHYDDFLDLQKKQMYLGENALGGHMNSYAWEEYADTKHKMNSQPPYSVRDNYKEGDFYKGMGIIRLSAYSYDLGSTDWKSEVIEKNSGGDIWGLNKRSSNELKPNFQVSLIKRIKDATS